MIEYKDENGKVWFKSGGDDEQYICEICGKPFASNSTLSLLFAICPECDKVAQTPRQAKINAMLNLGDDNDRI